MIVAAFFFLLAALAGTLIGIDWFRERNAMQQHWIDAELNDGKTPYDPQWHMSEGKWDQP